MFHSERTFLFRTYIILAGGLVLFAALLDRLFVELQEHTYADPTHQAEHLILAQSYLELLHEQLLNVPQNKHAQTIQRWNQTHTLKVQLLASEAVNASTADAPTLRNHIVQTISNSRGELFYVYRPLDLDGILMLGPIPQPQRNPWIEAIPLLFYVAVIVLIGLWLHPILTDIRTMTAAAQQFAVDYRKPLSTSGDVSVLKNLSIQLDDMAHRIGQLIENQKAISAALSHEMRTPLARIRMALALLRDTATNPQQSQIDDVSKDVAELGELIDAMLEYTKLDHPELAMNWQTVDPEAWASAIVEKFNMNQVNIDLRTHVNQATIDPHLMEIALSNILANAMRYANSQVVVTISQRGPELCIQVDDDGPGIPEAEHIQVFEAFTRTDTSRNRNTGGFGLGLAIVARIAKLHNGAASVSHATKLAGASVAISWQQYVNDTQDN